MRSTTRRKPLTSVRRSARLREGEYRLLPKDTEAAYFPISQNVDITTKEPKTSRKRTRDKEVESISKEEGANTGRKRIRLPSVGTDPPLKQTVQEDEEFSSVQCWIERGVWPKQLFRADIQTQRDLERDSWAEKYLQTSSMDHLLARKKSAPQLPRTPSQLSDTTPGTATPSDQKPREVKSSQYQDPRYPTLLETKNSFMRDSEIPISDESKRYCAKLLNSDQKTPKDSLFRDDLFAEACRNLQNRNEAKVIQDITRLITPSAETCAIYGDTHLKKLTESVNEGWNNSIPVTKPRPQPDYAVGFRRSAFTEEQLKKLEPFIGELTDTSFFMATYYMYFPFLTCEVKCGAAALEIADRQNAHSMTLAVRGVVELFRGLKREKELHREILAFSISHDHTSVRIYGHYALTDNRDTKFYRHSIRRYDFAEQDGKEKWTAYKFTRNVYDIWMPMHLKRICSAIDEIPAGVSFEMSQQSQLDFEEDAGQQLSQQLDYSLSQQSNADSMSLVDGSQASVVDSQEVTPDTSTSNRAEPAFKKPKNTRRG